MFEGKKIGALLLMAGDGARFGGEVPKQFYLLEGRELFRYSLDTFVNSGFFEEIILVSHPNWLDIAEIPEEVKVIPGGNTRQSSSYSGLKSFTSEPDIVLIHDAARPFVTEEILRSNILGALKHGAVNTCISSTDTLVFSQDGVEVDSIPLRSSLFRGQTPQTFSFNLILKAHEKAFREGIHNATDDCQLALNAGNKVFIVKGSPENLKITDISDIQFAELQLSKDALL